MAEQTTAPNYEQSMSFEATPLRPDDGINLHAASEGIASYAQGHALAQAAALDQRLGAAQGERRETPALAPEIVYLQQATKLLRGYRRAEFDLAA